MRSCSSRNSSSPLHFGQQRISFSSASMGIAAREYTRPSADRVAARFREAAELPEPGVPHVRLVGARPGHRGARGAVEKPGPQEISTNETPERAQGDFPGRSPAALRKQRAGGSLTVPLHLREALRERRAGVVQDGSIEALDGAGHDQVLVHWPREIVPEEVLAEETQVEVGMEPAVPQPYPTEMVAERQGVRSRSTFDSRTGRAREIVGGALVGVEAEDVLATGLAAGELVLPGEIVEGPRDDSRSRFFRDRAGPVARASVHDQHLVAESAQGGDARGDPVLLVLRHHHGGEAQRRSLRIRESTSVVEWPFGSPAITVRPPRRATTSRSGTDPSV